MIRVSFRRAGRAGMVLALAAGLIATAGSVAASVPTCFGHKATIVSPTRDRTRQVELRGTSGRDIIVGFGGSEVIDSRGGNDLICSGGGDDFIKSGPGDDRIKAGDGIDDIWGGGGDDRIWAGRGVAEGLHGGRGHDRLYGGAGTDDYLFPGPGDDLVDGGSGSDLVMLVDATRGVHVDLGAGTATGQGRDTIVAVESVFGSEFDDVIYGDERANTIAAGPGDDEVHGLGGDDRFRSGYGGTDLLDGGDGVNTAHYVLSWDPVQADLTAGEAVTSGTDTLIGITNLVGSRFADTLVGDDQDNLIHGSLDDDVIDGAGGADTAAYFDSYELAVDLVEGTAVDERGSDSLTNVENVIGSAFADSIVGDEGQNSFWGGRGNDSLLGAGGDDVLIGEGGTDSALGGDGVDTCDAEERTDCELTIMRGYRAAEYRSRSRGILENLWR